MANADERIDQLNTKVDDLHTTLTTFIAKFETYFYKNDQTGKKGIIVEHDEMYAAHTFEKKWKAIAFAIVGIVGIEKIISFFKWLFLQITISAGS